MWLLTLAPMETRYPTTSVEAAGPLPPIAKETVAVKL